MAALCTLKRSSFILSSLFLVCIVSFGKSASNNDVNVDRSHKRQVLQRIGQILPNTLQRGVSTRCARQCKCYSDREIHCTFRLLNQVPEEIPLNVVKINLAYNKIKRISQTTFAGTRSTLRFLFLQSNEIRSIHGGEFSGLTRLEVLRLSWNGISGIFKLSFDKLEALSRLHIDHNKITFIHPEAFIGLASLTLLQLEGNKLTKLHADNFATIRFDQYFSFSHIQRLYLGDNNLEVLPQALLPGMSSLQQVYLHGNPWECTCQIQWLHQWIRESNKYRCKRSLLRPNSEPECAVCASPPRLRGRIVEQVPFDNITCTPPDTLKPHEGAAHQRFDEDPTLTELQNEAMLFRHGSRAKESMTVRLDSPVSSLLLMHCNASREPETDTNIAINSSVTYVASFEQLMTCSINYPIDSARLDDIVTPYLNAALHFSARSRRLVDATYPIDYKVQIQGDPTSPLHPRGSGLRIVSASVLEASKVITSPQFTMTITSNRFRPEERKLVLLFRNQVNFRPNADDNYKDKPWTLLVEPYPAKQKTLITTVRRTFVLKCRAMGSPRPMLSWVLPNERVIRPGRRGGRFRVTNSGRLVIRRVKVDDAGVYYCIAKSIAKSGIAEDIGSVRLHIVQASSIAVENAVQENAVIGKSWRSDCTIDAAPSATIAWRTPSRQLLLSNSSSRDDETVHPDNSIEITNVRPRHAGTYSCIAANIMGAIMLPIDLDVIADQVEEVEETEIEDDYEFYSEDLDIDFVVTPDVPQRVTSTTSNFPKLKPTVPAIPSTFSSTKKFVFISSKPQIRFPKVTLTPTLTSRMQTPKTTTMPTEKTTIKSPKHAVNTTPPATVKITETKRKMAATISIATTESTTTKSAAFSVMPKTMSSTTQSTLTEGTAWSSMNMNGGMEVTEGTNEALENQTFGITTAAQLENKVGPKPDNTIGNTTQSTRASSSTLTDRIQSEEVKTTVQTPDATLFVTELPLTHATSDKGIVKSAESSKPSLDTPVTSIPNSPEKVSTTSQGGHVKLTTDHDILNDQVTIHDSNSVTKVAVVQNVSSNQDALELVTTSTPDPLSIIVHPSIIVPSKTGVHGSTDNKTTTNATFSVDEANVMTNSIFASPVNALPEVERVPSSAELQEEGSASRIIWWNATAASISIAPKEKVDTVPDQASRTTNTPINNIEQKQNTFVTNNGQGNINRSNGIAATDIFPRNATARPKMQLNETRLYREGSFVKPTEFSSAQNVAPRGAEIETQLDSDNEIFINQEIPEQRASASDLGLRDSNFSMVAEESFSGEFDTADSPILTYPSIVAPHGGSVDRNITKIVREAPGLERTVDTDRVDVQADAKQMRWKNIPLGDNKVKDGKKQVDILEKEVAHRRRKETVQYRTSNLIANYGDSLELQCPFQGDGTNAVNWTFKSHEKSDGLFDENLAKLGTAGHTSKLFISSLGMMHNGTFTCEMINSTQNFIHETKVSIRTLSPRIITPMVRRLNVNHGDSVNITCQAEGIPNPDVSWSWPRIVATRNNDSESSSLANVYSSPDNVLHIEKANENVQIMFLCVASNAVGRTLHELNVIVVSSPPIITSKLNKVATVLEGDEVTFECSGEGIPKPRMSWILPEGQELSKTDNINERILILHNDTLVLRNASRELRGRYRCVGKNVVGQSSAHVTLIVLNKPQVDEGPVLIEAEPAEAQTKRMKTSEIISTQNGPEKVYRSSLQRMVEESVFLHCRFPHDRKHRSRWWRFPGSIEWRLPNGEKASFPLPVPTWRHRTLYNGTLRISKLTREDSGTYTCLARNKKGTTRTEVDLTVEIMAPKIKQPLSKSITIGKNRKGGAECSTSAGNPKPQIRWTTPNGRTYSAGSWGNGFYIKPNGELVIRSMALSFAGRWRCVASNVAGNATRIVTVRTPPFAPKIKRSRSWMNYVKLGRTITMECSAVAVPPPSYYWVLPNGRRVVDNGAVNRRSRPGITMLRNGTLTIRGAAYSDDGFYKCFASNMMGTSVKTIKLRVYR